jgi:hypothetical protein
MSTCRTRLSLAAVALALAATLASAPGCDVITPDGTVEFRSGTGLTVCVRGSINLFIDGSQVGSMNAGQSSSFPVDAGSHSLRATSGSGSWGPRSVDVLSGQTMQWTLTC